jgi:hypothetical protein
MDCIYGDTIMNTIDNLQQGKLAGSLSNNTIIGTKNPMDEIIIENLKNKNSAQVLYIVNFLTYDPVRFV